MRRLVLIVTCIAVLGAGAAVWISGANATVTHKPVRRALTVPQPPASACYVAGGGCSEHPCTEFVSPSSAVYQPAISKCRRVTPGVARVSVGVVTAQPVR